jgi:hypothetical protein
LRDAPAAREMQGTQLQALQTAVRDKMHLLAMFDDIAGPPDCNDAEATSQITATKVRLFWSAIIGVIIDNWSVVAQHGNTLHDQLRQHAF